jgi:ABC-type nickel/cobalt efflux system permease component RcnA
MDDQLSLLCWTAASIGTLHTLLGPDHYLPFIALARARDWSIRKAMWITLLCGIGHVFSSVLLGAAGIAFGIAVLRLEHIEAIRGDWAGWLLLAFGLTYLIWGLRRAVRHRPHSHWHTHEDGTLHKHEHVHVHEHLHVHAHAPATGLRESPSPSLTPWVLFLIFLFGPCEPLIPILMYPAAMGTYWHVAIVTATFAVATLATMMTLVALGCVRFQRRKLATEEQPRLWTRYSHALAGFVVLLCGAAIKLGF